MKAWKRIVSTALAAFTALSFAACGQQTAVTTEDAEIHTVLGTLHKVKVTERNVRFAVNGETDYKI